MLFFHRGHTEMSTILFFTSDRLAFANISQTATTEKVLFVPDPITGNRLFIGNSTMVSYDGRCNISAFDGSHAALTIDTLNNRLGIGTSSPTSALHVVDSTGVQITGPFNVTGATVLTGTTNIIGTITASFFYGSAMGLTSIPAARLIGSLPTSVYGNATIPLTALSGYNNGVLGLSGAITADILAITSSLSVSQISTGIITSGEGDFTFLSTGNGIANTFTVGSLFAGSISSGSIGNLLTASGAFSSLSTGTANVDIINNRFFSTTVGIASSFTVGTLFAGTISSGSIGNLLTASGSFSSLSVGTANIDILNTRSLSIATARVSSLTVGNLFVGNISGSTAFFSTLSSGLVTANTLSSYVVYTSSIHTPNIYVTNIYANDGGIANVVASSLNASKAVFIQVIASSFQGTLLGKNILIVETL